MKVSIITPSYNQGQFIERTLQSVASQTGVEVEHVVFDGGSTDDTVSVLKRFRPEVRWVSGKDGGQAAAVNKGICATDGDIIGWLNSDDIFYPGAVERVVGFFETHPDVDVVYGMADHIDLEDRAFELYPTERWDFARLKETCIICQPALFFRRRVVAKYGLLDESLDYCMDYAYWLRLAKDGACFAYLEEKLAGSRLYADNKTLGSRVKVHKEINDMFKQMFGLAPDKWLFNYAHVVVESKVSRSKNPRWFMVRLFVSTICAAWHWNRRISTRMLRTMWQWVQTSFS